MTAFGKFEAIKVGDEATLRKVITEKDIQNFVKMTGDDNPLHVDRAYARKTPFKDIVVHGMLGASFISTVIGTKLPGTGALWVSQTMNFLLPVRLGDEILVSCVVLKKQEGQRLLELETTITNQNHQRVLEGSGIVRVLMVKEPELVKESEDGPGVVIVTGGAGGIGAAICRCLAHEGYKVVVNYNRNGNDAADLVQELARKNLQAIAVQADISTEKGVDALVEQANRAYGDISVLVNNASPRIGPRPFEDLAWEDIQLHLDVQVKGALLMSQKVLPSMIKNKFGRIINITSQVIEGLPVPHWTSYTLAKSALNSLSRSMAMENGHHKITVNCVAPGMTETSLIGDISEKAQLVAARQTPLRTLATPEQIADAVAFLSSERSSHITGQTLRVNGGSMMV